MFFTSYQCCEAAKKYAQERGVAEKVRLQWIVSTATHSARQKMIEAAIARKHGEIDRGAYDAAKTEFFAAIQSAIEDVAGFEAACAAGYGQPKGHGAAARREAAIYRDYVDEGMPGSYDDYACHAGEFDDDET